jgi:L-amino acid N-acyltransferase
VETGDAEALLAIYNPEVLETTVTFDVLPRELAEQLEWIAAHQGAFPALVATGEALPGPRGARGEPIAGYAAVSTYRDRAGYTTTVESSVYVAREARGLGVARRLMEDLLAACEAGGFHAVIARIVDHNEASIRLHEALGFELVGTEREVGRKHGAWLDVVVMERLLD